MIAHERNHVSVGRKLWIVAGRGPRKSDLHAGAVAQVIEPESAIGVKEQVRGVGRPEVARHLVALAMVAIGLSIVGSRESSELGAAHHDVRLAGAGIEID